MSENGVWGGMRVGAGVDSDVWQAGPCHTSPLQVCSPRQAEPVGCRDVSGPCPHTLAPRL
eukprot:351958-Chlamydomonas_euryale.AAC.4